MHESVFQTIKRKKRKKNMREKHWMSSATYVRMIKTCLELAWERIYFWLWCDLSDVSYPEFAKYSKSILIDLTVKVFYKDYFYIFLHSWLNICKLRLLFYAQSCLNRNWMLIFVIIITIVHYPSSLARVFFFQEFFLKKNCKPWLYSSKMSQL